MKTSIRNDPANEMVPWLAPTAAASVEVHLIGLENRANWLAGSFKKIWHKYLEAKGSWEIQLATRTARRAVSNKNSREEKVYRQALRDLALANNCARELSEAVLLHLPQLNSTLRATRDRSSFAPGTTPDVEALMSEWLEIRDEAVRKRFAPKAVEVEAEKLSGLGRSTLPASPERGPWPDRDDEFFWNKRRLKLQPLDAMVLSYLWKHHGKASYQKLLNDVWAKINHFGSEPAIESARNRISRVLLNANTRMEIHMRRRHLELDIPTSSENVPK